MGIYGPDRHSEFIARRSGRGLRYALILILLAIAGTALWSWLTLSWAYSDGTRAGILQKYSHRGWLCKTNEGDLAQYVVAGVSPQMCSSACAIPRSRRSSTSSRAVRCSFITPNIPAYRRPVLPTPATSSIT